MSLFIIIEFHIFVKHQMHIIDFKLSPCTEYSKFSLG